MFSMAVQKTSRITFIILRYMRRPILVLVTVYAVSMLGWILIPGVDPQGNPQNLSFFHAFYFLTYTVTTTGFGELPDSFTEAQRMWGIVSLYVGVIAWFYALGSIVGLVQNRDFQQSLAERRFAKRVSRLSEPFSIVCGYGNTGALLTRGLADAGMTVVVIDQDEDRINTLLLRDYRSEVLGLCADAKIPEHVIEAGLLKPNCRAVVALTKDEDVNLKISVTARLLNPNVWIATQSTSKLHEDALATLGENIHIVDPFQTYAKYLGATIAAPGIHTLNQWFAGTPGATLQDRLEPPRGTWIICGYGRMGQWIRKALADQGIETVVIDPHLQENIGLERAIAERANQENLRAAGIAEAAGIVAGTDNDADNLSIILNARAINPDIFCVVRQNRYRNQVVFSAAQANLIMMPSLVSARRMLFLLIAPMMKSFFERLRKGPIADQEQAIGRAIEELSKSVGGSQPRVWTLEVNKARASALKELLETGSDVTLAQITSDPTRGGQPLICRALVIQSREKLEILPPGSRHLALGDQILFCGDQRAYHLLDATLNNIYTMTYLVKGSDPPRGWVMQWFNRRWAP